MGVSVQAAVVTGATGALGRTIVNALVTSGISVLAAGRQQLELHADSEVVHLGPGCDLSSTGGASRLANIVSNTIQSRFSVVNCVGYFPGYRPFLDLDYSEAERTLQSNFNAVYLSALKLIPIMMGRGGGQFIAFTSLSTGGAYPLMSAFDSAKAAVEQLTRHLANEFASENIQANAFALATLKTAEEMQLKPRGDHDHWVEPKEVAELVQQVLLGKFELLNGNVIKCYHYSPTYYGTSYFERIKGR